MNIGNKVIVPHVMLREVNNGYWVGEWFFVETHCVRLRILRAGYS